MPTRPSICSGRSTCFPTTFNGVRRSSIKRSKVRSSWSSRPSSTTRIRPRSCRRWRASPSTRPTFPRSSSASRRKARRARSGDQEERLPAQAFDRMETWAAAFILLGNQYRDMNLKGDEGVEAVLRNNFATDGQADRRARNQPPAVRLLRQAAGEGPGRPARRRGRQFQERGRRNSRPCSRPGQRATSAAIARTFDRDLAGSPELAAGADPQPQRQLEEVDRAAPDAARRGHDRRRRRPSRRQRLGDRAAQARRLSSPPCPISDTRRPIASIHREKFTILPISLDIS